MSTDIHKFKILWLLCVGIVCYAAFYLANIYLLHNMTIEVYGDFAVSVKVLAILCSLLTIAKQFSLTIYMPQYEKSHKYIQRNGIVLWLSKNLLISTIILIIGITATWGAFYLIHNETFYTVFKNSPFHFLLLNKKNYFKFQNYFLLFFLFF